MDISISNSKEYVSVDYPAIIENIDKALLALGGNETLTKTYNNSERLELRFRPKDTFCKPVYGDRLADTSLLLKVRRKKGAKDSEVKSEIVGVVNNTYEFRGMADYQYVPVERRDNRFTVIHDDVVMNDLCDLSWLKEPNRPSFIPPAIFSRTDVPQKFYYQKDFKSKTPTDKQTADVTRKREPAIFVKFGIDKVPKETSSEFKFYKTEEKYKKSLEELRKLFEKQPIWCRSGLIANCNLSFELLKRLLPVVAFHWMSGPWRTLWNRFDYDPRQHPEAKIYQTLDFRIRKQLNVDVIPARRTHRKPKSDSYKFKVGCFPAFKQTYYQMCDVEVPEVQKIIHSNDGTENKCSERDGWCEEDTIDKCRDVLTKHIEELESEQGETHFKNIRPKQKKKTRRRMENVGNSDDTSTDESTLEEMKAAIDDSSADEIQQN